MIHDVIIIGAGASGLFAGMNLDKSLSKLILEKTDKPGTKVLLSGGERANVSNINIDTEIDYFSQNNKFLLSVFSKFNQWDTMSFFAEKGINLIEEDRGRLILESGNSKELLNMLLAGVKDNNCQIKFEEDVCEIIPQSQPFPPREKGVVISLPRGETERGAFQITTKSGKKFQAKNVIISTGGKSFFQVGTTGEGFSIAEKLGINVISPYRALCGMSTKKDLSSISGVSCRVDVELKDNNPPSVFQTSPPSRGENKSRGRKKNIIYKESGPVLFTHFGVTGPCIHNISNVIGEYLNSLKLDESEFEKYILKNFNLDIKFDLENTPKRVLKFFEQELFPPYKGGCPTGQEDTKNEGSNIVNLELQNWRSWKEAKATGGGIDTLELDNHMQSKKYKGLYFVGEVVDVTGKTGGYNLQWAWSSAFVASKNIK